MCLCRSFFSMVFTVDPQNQDILTDLDPKETSRGLSHPRSQFELRWSLRQDKWNVVISVSSEESVPIESKERIDFPPDFLSKQNPFLPTQQSKSSL